VLARVTPLILTYNERPNIERTLSRLDWASRIVVVDSFSDDGTVEILRGHQRVDLVQREFDTFASQCNFGLDRIETDWVLSLDADYLCSAELVDEIAGLPIQDGAAGFAASFVYCVYGKALRGTLYPPRVVLFRIANGRYVQDGHAHRLQLAGPVRKLSAPIYHDDRKAAGVWLRAQLSYSEAETRKLTAAAPGELGRVDRLRKIPFFLPLLTPFYCLFFKRLLLDGRAGLYYTAQRTLAELLLSVRLLDESLAQRYRQGQARAGEQRPL
jgi:glycosyltransferase involved in cell wall biosynthesis